MIKSFIAYIEYDPDSNLYVGTVPGLSGAHTQAETLNELQNNLKEVIELCIEEFGNDLPDLPHIEITPD